MQSDPDRDGMYVSSMLPSAVTLCESRIQGFTYYNEAANDYNNGLHQSFSGWLARLTGLRDAVVFAE